MNHVIENIISRLPIESIQNVSQVNGGDVNEAYKLKADDEDYFLLVQHHVNKDFYDAEVQGLRDFKAAGITAPCVIDYGETEDAAYLMLEYLEEGSKGSQQALGELVAELHRHHHPEGKFGYQYPYRGKAISFSNQWQDNWISLFLDERMQQLSKAIIAEGLWNEADIKQYEQAERVMREMLTVHHSAPSLLHGDLWGGNVMFLTDGTPALYDPSPLYGDREFDLGATLVFGGFSEQFYKAYHAAYPLAERAGEQIEYYKLYLLMIHLLKFGRTYYRSVQQSMDNMINRRSCLDIS